MLETKKIYQIDKDSLAILYEYDSINSAAKKLAPDAKDSARSAIIDCCKGRRKSYKGYIWEYADKEREEKEMEVIEKQTEKNKDRIMDILKIIDNLHEKVNTFKYSILVEKDCVQIAKASLHTIFHELVVLKENVNQIIK